jgi:DNA-binding beta-propeller fold protein YncE
MKKFANLKSLAKTMLIAGTVFMAGCATEIKPVKEAVIPVFPLPPDEPRFYYERTLFSSADVVPEDPTEEMKRSLLGGARRGEGMAKPYGVAVHHGRVFVGDTAARSVVVFDIPAGRHFRIGEEEPGALVMPLGLDVDAAGNLYVADVTAKRIQVYDRDGKYLRTLAGPDWFDRPSGIAVDAEGSRIYVVDGGGVKSENHRVRVFDAKSGEHLFDFGKRGAGDGEFNLPRDIAIAPDGSLYVVDAGNFRVGVFKPDGTFVRNMGAIGRRSGQFSRPKEVAVDADGNAYVVDTAFGNFQIFNPEGQLLLAVGGRSEMNAPAKYMLPSGIAIDGDGRVYMVDQYFRKVEVYRPAKLAADAGFVRKNPAAAKK